MFVARPSQYNVAHQLSQSSPVVPIITFKVQLHLLHFLGPRLQVGRTHGGLGLGKGGRFGGQRHLGLGLGLGLGLWLGFGIEVTPVVPTRAVVLQGVGVGVVNVRQERSVATRNMQRAYEQWKSHDLLRSRRHQPGLLRFHRCRFHRCQHVTLDSIDQGDSIRKRTLKQQGALCHEGRGGRGGRGGREGREGREGNAEVTQRSHKGIREAGNERGGEARTTSLHR